MKNVAPRLRVCRQCRSRCPEVIRKGLEPLTRSLEGCCSNPTELPDHRSVFCPYGHKPAAKVRKGVERTKRKAKFFSHCLSLVGEKCVDSGALSRFSGADDHRGAGSRNAGIRRHLWSGGMECRARIIRAASRPAACGTRRPEGQSRRSFRASLRPWAG